MASRIDEIRRRLASLPETPEAVDLLVELSGLLRDDASAKALVQAETAAAMAARLGYREGEASAWRAVGASHERLADYPQAVKAGLRALALPGQQ